MINKFRETLEVVSAHANIDTNYGPYKSIELALKNVPKQIREIGRTVGVIEGGSVVEYWFKSGIEDSDIEVKSSGGLMEIETLNTPPITFTGNGTTTTPLSLTITPVSATLKGIVNNISLQELGGTDKLINGVRIGRGNTNFENNLVISRNGLASNTTGKYNTAIGNGDGQNEGVLQLNTTGKNNTSVGSDSMVNNTTGSNNNAFGAGVLFYNSIGTYNTGLGDYSLFNNTSGQWNTAVDSSSLNKNTTGQRNTAVGTSLYWNGTGQRNTAIGFNSLYANNTGSFNTAIGEGSGYINGVGSYNTLIGGQTFGGAGYSSAPSTINYNRNVIIGYNIIGANGTNDTLAIDNKGATSTNPINALIYGGFSDVNRFVKINGNFKVNQDYLTTDSTYTKMVVSKVDGTFGIVDRPNVINNSYSTTEIKTGGTWINGKPIYTQYVTINLLAGSASAVGFAFPTFNIIDFEKCFLTLPLGTRKTPPGTNAGFENDWFFSIENDSSILVKPDVSSAQVRTISGVLIYTKTTD